MASTSPVRFDNLVKHLCEKVHHLGTDQLEVYLSNTTPNVATHIIKANLAEIATGNGYTGPVDTQNTGAGTATYTVTGTKVVITATGVVGPFRYVVLYNTTPTSPADPLIGYWDYGSSITLQNGETFSIKFNNSETTGTIFTLT